MRHWVWFLSVFSFCALSNQARASFDFVPVVAQLEPSGSKSNFTFTLTNTSGKKTPVQISIVHRNPDEEGKEEHKETPDIDDLFQIFPAQTILNPGEKRSVRVAWVGDPKLKQELCFRIIAEEYPVDVEDPNKVYKTAQGQVSLLFKYVGSLYVGPKEAEGKMVVTGTPTQDSPPKLKLEVKNTGAAHYIYKQPVLTVVSSLNSQKAYLEGEEIKALQTLNILPGKMRRFTIPWPGKLPVGPVQVSLSPKSQ